MSLKIMQGDQYAIVFTGTQDGTPLDLGIGTTYVGIRPGYGSSVSFVKEEE